VLKQPECNGSKQTAEKRITASQRVSRLASQQNGLKAMLRSRFLAKNRIFPVIFRGQISPYGIFWAVHFSNGIDFKRVKNNLQGFLRNLYPRGV
jgi:hypothetical protein